jgi:hypothetical protein
MCASYIITGVTCDTISGWIPGLLARGSSFLLSGWLRPKLPVMHPFFFALLPLIPGQNCSSIAIFSRIILLCDGDEEENREKCITRFEVLFFSCYCRLITSPLSLWPFPMMNRHLIIFCCSRNKQKRPFTFSNFLIILFGQQLYVWMK